MEEDKINIDNAVIEITRRCNLKCEHCLRGRAEDLEIKDEYIDTFFSRVNYISSLTITGGEPSLAVPKIKKIIEYAKKHDTDIGNFYIATNAYEKNFDFILAIMELYGYCSDNEVSGVNWSNDNFHTHNDEQIKLLSTLSFVSPKYGDDYRGAYPLIREGRSKTGRENTVYNFEIEDNFVRESEVYLNCNGDIIHGCDWSFKNQTKHKVCNVTDLNMETLEKYVNKFETKQDK